MTNRFQIEEIVGQDDAGITFRCIDAETGQLVSLRRFFPFGAEGDGLFDEEAAAYLSVLSRLAELRHPSLRKIIAGGCDPIDGMPYIVQEWIEGPTLEEKLASAPLSAEQTQQLLSDALAASEAFSPLLGVEALWVDTGLKAIVLAKSGSGFHPTFSLSPTKWLGESGVAARGAESLAPLARAAMHWKTRPVPDHAANGLGRWLRHLKTNAGKSTLAQLRDSLQAPAPKTPSHPATATIRPISQPAKPTLHEAPLTPPRKKSLILPLLLITILVVSGAAAWHFFGPQVVTALRKEVPRKKPMIPPEEESALNLLHTTSPAAKEAPPKKKTVQKPAPASSSP